jgi:hypothetical protein
MIDFSLFLENQISIKQITCGLEISDLQQLTREMVDAMLAEIMDARQEDVIFTPEDPDAFDEYAVLLEEKNLSWTLGHVIVHTTASAEESAALSSVLARGIRLKPEDRSRYEIPWQQMTSVQQLYDRLEESRRIRYAFLNTWPMPPHLENTYTPDFPGNIPLNAIDRFTLGLTHDYNHLGQIRKIMAQARQMR